MVDPDYPFYPEAAVKDGFRAVPMLVITGKADPFHGAKAATIPEAKAAGMGNSEWMFDGLRKAIAEQKDSPHKLLVLSTGHVPTAKKDGHPVHDEVDKFIRKAVSSRKSYPFKKTSEAASPETVERPAPVTPREKPASKVAKKTPEAVRHEKVERPAPVTPREKPASKVPRKKSPPTSASNSLSWVIAGIVTAVAALGVAFTLGKTPNKR